MESLTKINYNQPQFSLSIRPKIPSFSPPISSISLKPQFSCQFPTSSFKLRYSSSSSSSKSATTMAVNSTSATTMAVNSNSNPASNPKTLNPFSLLKTPLTIAVAATAVFFSGFAGYKQSIARADTASPPMAETASNQEDEVSNEVREKELEEVVASNPSDVEALKSLMEVKVKNKKLVEAVDVIDKLIELEPEEVEWPLLKSHMHSYLGEFNKAKSGFEEILAKDPVRAEAFHGLIMAVSQGDSDGQELELVTKRIKDAMAKCVGEKKEEEVRDLKLLIAQIRVIEGKYVEALKVYEEIVKEEPRDFRPYLCQGIIYTLLKRKDEAQKQFDKYKKLVPKGHPYAKFFDDNMLATKVLSQMAENESMKMGSKN